MRRPILLAVLILATSFFISRSYAQDWGMVPNISSTMGVNTGRICYGESSRGDIGCPADAPTISGSTITGTFIGDGSALTGVIAAGSDRIVSGTAKVIANGNTNSISITEAGVTTGYYYNGIWVAGGVSTTGTISATNAYVSNSLNVGTNIITSSSLTFPNGTKLWSSIAGGHYDINLNAASNGSVNITASGNLPVVTSGFNIRNVVTNDGGSFNVFRNGQLNMMALNTSGSLTLGDGNAANGTSQTVTIQPSNSNGNVRATSLILRGGATTAPGSYASGDLMLIGGLPAGSAAMGNVLLGYDGTSVSTSLVGVNTNAPKANLQVSGTTRITSWTTIAADVTASTALDVYGTVSATNFIGNGSGLTGVIAAGSDRIASNTVQVIANGNTNSVSITESGVTTGYYYNGIWVAGGVSSTGPVSASEGYFATRVGIGVASPTSALQVRNKTYGNYALNLDTINGGSVGLLISATGAGVFSRGIDINSADIGIKINGTMTKGVSVSPGTGTAFYANPYGFGGIGAGLYANGGATALVLSSQALNSPLATMGYVSGTHIFTGTGLVGFGTATPTAPLEVSGTVSATALRLADSPAITCNPTTYGTTKFINGRPYYCRP